MLLPPVFPPVSISTLSFDTVGFEALSSAGTWCRPMLASRPLLARASSGRLTCPHHLAAARIDCASRRRRHWRRAVEVRGVSTRGTAVGVRASMDGGDGGSSGLSEQLSAIRATAVSDGAPLRVLVVGKVFPERCSTAAGVRTGDLVLHPPPPSIASALHVSYPKTQDASLSHPSHPSAQVNAFQRAGAAVSYLCAARQNEHSQQLRDQGVAVYSVRARERERESSCWHPKSTTGPGLSSPSRAC